MIFAQYRDDGGASGSTLNRLQWRRHRNWALHPRNLPLAGYADEQTAVALLSGIGASGEDATTKNSTGHTILVGVVTAALAFMVTRILDRAFFDGGARSK